MSKDEALYPWGGEYTTGNPTGCVAVVLLTIEYTPPASVAIYGNLKTENIGIEKIIANVISNPYIRYLVICGQDIRGHRSGSSLCMLHAHGIDNNHRIIQAPGAIPYIENLPIEAIERFRQQITIIDLINETNPTIITQGILNCIDTKPACFGEPFIALRITQKATPELQDKRALHSKIIVSYLGKITKR